MSIVICVMPCQVYVMLYSVVKTYNLAAVMYSLHFSKKILLIEYLYKRMLFVKDLSNYIQIAMIK